MRLTILCFSLALFSCGSASKIRRAEKLIAKAEALGATWKTDTVYVTDTLLLPEVRWDTLTMLKLGDTVTITKDKIQIEMIRLPGDSIFVDVNVPADTIYKEIPITITKELHAKGWLRWWMLVIAFLAGMFLWMGYIQSKKL